MKRTAAGVTGFGLVLVTVNVILVEWGGGLAVQAAEPVLALALIALLTPQVRRGRQVFVLIGIALTVALVLRESDWLALSRAGLEKAAFICAFFCALASLRNVAENAPSIQNAGRFLAMQPPGRRYIALTFGGQMFALVLNYGAIALLGALATASMGTEQDPRIRRIRTRRMLLAIQRGFTSTLPWSPLSFAVAITTELVPGTSWATVVVPGLLTAFLMAGTGWALDTIFKPRVVPQHGSREKPDGSWMLLLPLMVLLVLIMGSSVTLFLLTGIRVVGLVLLVVPVVALAWAFLQARGAARGGGQSFRDRIVSYMMTDLPGVKEEVVLLMMAGYIGTVGSALLTPAIASSGLHLSDIPTPLILVACIFVVPLAGQFGMNPILAVTLLVPLIPSAEVLGVSPTAVVVAITAGWSLAAATSPFTATTLLIGSFGRVSARHVGLVWNRWYFIVTSILLSVWILIFGLL